MLLVYISGDAICASCIQTQTFRMKSMTTSIKIYIYVTMYIIIEYRVQTIINNSIEYFGVMNKAIILP